ncbi:MAG: type II secretion system secretin GspD [Myxococcales bacterium]|nr:type II secretion system secretin GspD [Myxococcales bacterium]
MKLKAVSLAGTWALTALFAAPPLSAQQAPPLRRPGATPAPAAPAPAPAPPPGRPGAPAAPAPGAPVAGAEKEPPGAKGNLPNNMDQIAKATDVQFRPKPGGHLVKFNLQDADLAELVNHISGMTGRRFIYGPKVRQVKATVVSPEPVTLAEAYEAFLSILEANGMTVVPHGRFLKIIDSAGSVTAPTPVYARGEPVPASDRYVTRLYRLKNVSVDEANALLSKFKSKEADISVYGPGQLLIMTDTGTNIRRMIRILEEIDVGGAGSRMWIEPVHYGSASDMAKRINELFELDKGQAGGGGGGGLSKVVADDQTNSLIVVGTEDSYHKLLELMKRIDTQPAAEGKVHVMPLQHATAEELANVLTQMLQGAGRQPGQQGGAAGMFEGDVRVIADKATNSLIVTSSGRDYSAMRLVVNKLDRPRRQVFIEAVIMDVSVKHSTNLGVSFHGGATADLGGGGDSLFLGGFQASNSLTFPANPELLQGVALGARGPELAGTSNLLGTGLSIPAFGVVLQALASSGDANVLATPHILATDNTAAEISVGENVPLQTNLGGGSGLSSLAGLAGGQAGAAGALANLPLLSGGFNAPRQDVGIKIKVTPHLNETNQVRLEIEQEISEAGSAVGALGVVPITKRTARTTVEVDDQQTIVLGGLMREAERKSRKKIPVLGDLPVLGFLFRHSEVTKEKLNLLLVLTPTVIHGQEDLRKIFERKMQERQEFIDRYFVFSGQDWKPPLDYAKTNGLVEEIRQAYFAVEEQQRLEAETRPKKHEHTPGEPIDLPHSVRPGSGGGATPPPPTPATPARPARPRQPRPATPPVVDPGGNAVPPPGANPPRGGSLDSPIRINPIARNVSVERVE